MHVRTAHILRRFVGAGTPAAVVAVTTIVVVGTARAGGGCEVPVNEDCDGQIVFSTADLPFHDSGLLGCSHDVTDKPYWDIFYRYDCTVTATHTFAMCDSEGDTYIRIYSGGCGWADGDEFAVADDNCPSSPPNADPLLVVALEAGQSYWIELGTWRPDPPWGAPNLPFVFDVTVEEPCLGDGNEDGAVDILDLLDLLAAWGSSDPTWDLAPGAGDGIVDIQDLLVLLGAWGPC
ncbi:MAG: GC-type dockerin domain-anchored protein [Planctomycetota bacterium]|jgi:hypothetical protein